MNNALLKEQGAQLLRSFVPAKVIQSRLHKRVIMDFADKTGLVYFGYVDQRNDEHRLVRGLTVSANHKDNHYCIGTFQGYDVTLVERTDMITFPGKAAKAHDWIIVALDLHSKADIPHIFLGLHSHSDVFYAHLFTKFAKLSEVTPSTFGAADPTFSQRYTIYGEAAHASSIEQLFDQPVTKIIGEQFGSLTIEIADGCLYVYAEHQRPTGVLLDKMMRYGIWLAATIDSRM